MNFAAPIIAFIFIFLIIDPHCVEPLNAIKWSSGLITTPRLLFANGPMMILGDGDNTQDPRQGAWSGYAFISPYTNVSVTNIQARVTIEYNPFTPQGALVYVFQFWFLGANQQGMPNGGYSPAGYTLDVSFPPVTGTQYSTATTIFYGAERESKVPMGDGDTIVMTVRNFNSSVNDIFIKSISFTASTFLSDGWRKPRS